MLALSAVGGQPRVSYLRLPHPSGIAVDRANRSVHVACTRNPNQVMTFRPLADEPHELAPVRCVFYPGSLYLHDLALVNGRLLGNAVGQNAVVDLDPSGVYTRVWWPRSIERPTGPDFGRNYLQLNSIAAGPDARHSYYSASAAEPGRRRPGQPSFPVDGRGVVFSGCTREPIAGGLTRPHSARLFRDRLWVANSGYGTVGVVTDGRYEPIAQLPGWTRGLGFVDTPDGGIVFAGTSRVLPNFRHYAPGVDGGSCAVHAISVASGECLAQISWPAGNQIFAIESLPSADYVGLPLTTTHRRRRLARMRQFFSTFTIAPEA
jgi:uncharacterized protein (TIGR03032 family)